MRSIASFCAVVLCLAHSSSGLVVLSASDLASLNSTIGGRLSLVTPLAKPCYNNSSSPRCAAVQSNYLNHTFRSDHVSAYQNTQWETCQTTGDQCLLDANNPENEKAFEAPQTCKQGGLPSYYIDVRGPDDVKAAFSFSQKTNIPLVIKNTGHDYLGRSAGPGTLSLWTHKLQSMTFVKNFQPAGCPPAVGPKAAITIGAGQRFQEIFNFAKANNVTFVGGTEVTVGAAGGWVQGGGHSALSITQGLGVDRVLQFKIVTPDGQYRIANQCQNQDLFWALRGGGGGTFGVVLEASFYASPPVNVQVAVAMYPPSRNNSFTVMKGLSKNAVKFASEGWAGYSFQAFQGVLYANAVLNVTAAQDSSAYLKALVESVGGNFTLLSFPTFTDFFNLVLAPSPDAAGIPQALVTRLIPDTSFDDDAVIDASINAMLDTDIGQLLAVTPYAFKDYKPGDTSVNPAWRTAVWHITSANTWNFDATTAVRIAKYKDLETKWAKVRALTPKAGAYLNEADVNEPNWQSTFWGDNYAKLLTIKNKYDPHRLLDCWKCVGWKGPSDPRYKCYITTN